MSERTRYCNVCGAVIDKDGHVEQPIYTPPPEPENHAVAMQLLIALKDVIQASDDSLLSHEWSDVWSDAKGAVHNAESELAKVEPKVQYDPAVVDELIGLMDNYVCITDCEISTVSDCGECLPCLCKAIITKLRESKVEPKVLEFNILKCNMLESELYVILNGYRFLCPERNGEKDLIQRANAIAESLGFVARIKGE